jgi:autotransporter-associated beta strand protein
VTILAWQQGLGSSLYNDPANWTPSVVPGTSDVAVFAASDTKNIAFVNDARSVGEWLFNPGASQYNFEISQSSFLSFDGTGITVNAGLVHIFDFGDIEFQNSSTAGSAVIDDFFLVEFNGFTSAGGATIHVAVDSDLLFTAHSTAGSAQIITEPGALVDFSVSSGPDSLRHITAGSIAGAGILALGGDQLIVGLNGLSTEVSGPINDGGDGGGSGASLVKVGPGALKLSHAGNTYSGGTFLAGGKLDVAAVGAVGPGAITFAGNATLKIENAALTAHHFANPIDLFARHDFIDLAGLKFHAGASATYHKANHHLTVHSGTVTDTLTLVSPHSTHFTVVSDGHGGTDVLLDA